MRLHRCVERVHLHVLEPCVLVGRLEDVWAAEAERPGVPGAGAGRPAMRRMIVTGIEKNGLRSAVE